MPKDITLQSLLTVTAAQLTAGSGTIHCSYKKELGLEDLKEALLSIRVTAADRSNSNETYNVYVWSGIKLPSGNYAYWDIWAVPQITADSTVIYSAKVLGYGVPYLSTITTADPGVLAVVSGTMTTTTSAAGHSRCTLTAGMVRHGALGKFLGWSLVGGGTTPGPFTFEIAAHLR